MKALADFLIALAKSNKRPFISKEVKAILEKAIELCTKIADSTINNLLANYSELAGDFKEITTAINSLSASTHKEFMK